ncbi:SemiSWEET family sugar transporter [Spiroplasma eriocheiris]|uniref:MtN3 and saliva related transmembrane protein n=1 Tax=Spiroplasma eriocheiris TaxID=315358 RepID=A0A0H3XLP7_9MOLU|nr:PQ-loop domain-containing transporter [Spiroplasma eriocheiris]AHF57231.1 hypothetical protein SPE_0095 [Spiroplasma eriocheiris CCTCC M 207170]AKM53697.1 hypothetical protein SERIO_v1c00950 [Spiroplasma eriocheiris]
MFCFFSVNNVPLSLIVGQAIGYFAALLGIITCLPQLIKTLKTRNTTNISLATYCLFNLANLLWLIFGVLSISCPQLNPTQSEVTKIMWSLTLIVPYFVTFTGISIILGIKIYNIKKHGELLVAAHKKLMVEKINESKEQSCS